MIAMSGDQRLDTSTQGEHTKPKPACRGQFYGDLGTSSARRIASGCDHAGIASGPLKMVLLPKLFSHRKCVNLIFCPPPFFIPHLVKFPVVPATERDGEFITHLETDRPRLRKPQVMGIGRLPAADQARL